MQKTITKTIILLAVLTLALSVNYIFAAWVGPTQAPPLGNTAQPVHVGMTDQVKNGGLSLDGLSVFGGGYFQGNVGVGVVTPSQKLDVDGGIEIGNTTNESAGTIRWTGSDFEGYNGSAWVSLVSGEAVVTVDPAYTDCLNAGGNWIDAQNTCYIAGTSCPGGWTKNENYSSTLPNTCYQYNSCTTGFHSKTNTSVETCGYLLSKVCTGRIRGGACYKWETKSATCYAIVLETGCTKN